MILNNPIIDQESKNPSGSDDASPAINGIKGFGAKAGEIAIRGFSGLHLLYHWEQVPNGTGSWLQFTAAPQALCFKCTVLGRPTHYGPHSQTQANKEEILPCQIVWDNLIDSGVTYIATCRHAAVDQLDRVGPVDNRPSTE